MKYFFILIWIVLQQGISSLPQDRQIYFLQNNFDKMNENSIYLDIDALKEETGEESETGKEFILKRNANAPTPSVITHPFKGMLNLKKGAEIPLNFYLLSTTVPSCQQYKTVKPAFRNVECTYVPGKIICQLGRFNFVINNGDHYMDKEVVEKFITMAYQRYGEGDNSFDVAVDEMETTQCGCYRKETESTTEEVAKWNQRPVTVECNLVSNDKLKLCNPLFEPTEKIYQCKAKTMGLRKRDILHIAISSNGLVSFTKDPDELREKVRKKREYSMLQEPRFINGIRKIHRPRRFNNYFEENSRTEPNDLSNLYYHSKVPYVRNYTDTCTLQYQFYPWCPIYKTDPCGTSTSAVPQDRPCRQLESTTQPSNTIDTCTESSTECVDSTTAEGSSGAGINTTTICTIEITTEEALLKQTRIHSLRKKRHRRNRRRRRRLQKPLMFNNKRLEMEKYIDRSDSNSNRHSRQFLAESSLAEGSTQNSENQSTNQTTCPPCDTTQETGSSWCTMCMTVPCNVSSTTTCVTVSNEGQTQPPTQKQSLVDNSINQVGEVTPFNEKKQMVPPANSYSVQELKELNKENQFPEIGRSQHVQMPYLNRYGPQSSFSNAYVQSDYNDGMRYALDKFSAQNLGGVSSGLQRQFHRQYRPKRMYFRKIPRFKRKFIDPRLTRPINARDINDI